MFTVKRLAVLLIIATLLAPSYFGTQSVDAAADDVYVTDISAGDVETFSPTAPHAHMTTFGGAALSSPNGIAIDSTGHIYVVDNGAVDKFSPTGTHMTTFGGAALVDPYGIAIDSTDHVYVADGTSGDVEKFSSTGTHMTTFGGAALEGPNGIAIDSTDHVYVADGNSGDVEKFSSTGTHMTTFGGAALEGPIDIAIDSTDHVYVADGNSGDVEKFSSTGTHMTTFGGAALVDPRGIAIDSTDHVYVVDNVGDVEKFSSTGTHMTTFGGAALVGPIGIAIAPTVGGHGGHSGGDTCTETIAHLISEMTNNRTYMQFHTDDGNAPTNSAPGDLSSPGEIRGDIAPNTTPNPTMFMATANKAQNVHSGGSEPAAWTNALATATVTLMERQASGSTPHHIAVTIVMGAHHALANISGIHIHNGAPGHSNTLHLADILTGTASLLKDHHGNTVSAGASLSAGATYTAMITASDVCPTSHSGGHDHGGDSGSGGDTCTETIAHLISEMTNNRTYMQFHTDDGNAPTNSAPGDLSSPGEIRADIAPNDHHSPTSFGGTADKSKNVHSGGSEPAAWTNALATAQVTLEETPASGSTPHHIAVTIVMGAHHALANISGIHIHNGAPGHSNTLHLADILTGTASLLKDHHGNTVSAGASLSAGATYTAMITASDVCPTSHSGGHDHGGDSGSGDSGSGDSGSGSTTGKVFDIVTLILAGQVLQPGDYLSVANYGNTAVGGEFQARLPCDANGVPLVLVVSGHIDANPQRSHMADANLVIVEHLSTKGKSCLYQASWPAASTMNNAGAQQISSVGLYNACEKNTVFRTANVAIFHANDDRGAIDYTTLPGSLPVFPSDGNVVIDKYDGTSISGNVCGLTSGDSGGSNDGHDHGSHNHG